MTSLFTTLYTSLLFSVAITAKQDMNTRIALYFFVWRGTLQLYLLPENFSSILIKRGHLPKQRLICKAFIQCSSLPSFFKREPPNRTTMSCLNLLQVTYRLSSVKKSKLVNRHRFANSTWIPTELHGLNPYCLWCGLELRQARSWCFFMFKHVLLHSVSSNQSTFSRKQCNKSCLEQLRKHLRTFPKLLLRMFQFLLNSVSSLVELREERRNREKTAIFKVRKIIVSLIQMFR